MKANFKVPHATSNKPKKPHQGSDLCEISNYASRASSFPNKFAKLLYNIMLSAGTYTQTYHSRTRGYNKSVSSSSHYRRRERRIRTGAGGGQADPGRGGEAAGGELAEDKRQEWSWRRTSGWWQDWMDPDSTVELVEDKWTQAVQRS